MHSCCLHLHKLAGCFRSHNPRPGQVKQILLDPNANQQRYCRKTQRHAVAFAVDEALTLSEADLQTKEPNIVTNYWLGFISNISISYWTKKEWKMYQSSVWLQKTPRWILQTDYSKCMEDACPHKHTWAHTQVQLSANEVHLSQNSLQL